MPTITAVVHTKNSEKTLDLCLWSLGWCDFIFVVDMESEDATEEIARRHGARFFSVKSKLNFADPIRNEYLTKVKTDWTLIVDSDEEVPASLAEKIIEVIKLGDIDGFSLPRKNIVLGKWMQHTGYWPDYIVRLFKTGKANYPPSVHAQPVVDGKHDFLPADERFALVHHHYSTIYEFIERANKYTSLEVEKLTKVRKEYSAMDGLREFFSQFHTRYFQMEGYKDGSHGLVLSLLSSAYQMLSYLKAWEITKNETAISLDDIEWEVTRACDATSYWAANEKLKEKNVSFLKKIQLKLIRKLH